MLSSLLIEAFFSRLFCYCRVKYFALSELQNRLSRACILLSVEVITLQKGFDGIKQKTANPNLLGL